jgi:transposase InsO family protein
VRADPAKASARQQRDAALRPKIRRVWDDNWKVYGVRKAWRQLCREGEATARCTVARLMKGMGLRGIVRGKVMKTTVPDMSVPCPRDKVNRKFRAPAPNMLRPFSDAKGITYRVTGQRLYLCLNMARVCLRRLRDRHLRQPHRRLESVATLARLDDLSLPVTAKDCKCGCHGLIGKEHVDIRQRCNPGGCGALKFGMVRHKKAAP